MFEMCKFGVLLAAVLGLACGGSSSDQMSARDQATKHVCDRAQACGLIAAGMTYTTRDDCEVRQRDFWQTAWPPAECDGHIADTQLTACLVNIDAIQCSSPGADFVSAAYLGPCTKARICSGASSK